MHKRISPHGDYDHMGEAVNLVNNFKVEKVIFNCGEYNDLEKSLISVLEKKDIKYYSCIDEINIDKYKLQFLNTKEYDNENDNSNVIYFNYNNYKFLFMGNSEIKKKMNIIDKYNLSNIDFLKVGHHGLNTSSDIINPKNSLISVGKNNRYGHLNKEVLENLKDSKIYRTDQDLTKLDGQCIWYEYPKNSKIIMPEEFEKECKEKNQIKIFGINCNE